MNVMFAKKHFVTQQAYQNTKEHTLETNMNVSLYKEISPARKLGKL
jgi:hypothetical protein